MKFVNVYTAENSFEANFIKDDLAESGIECILTHETITSLMPHMNGMLGQGVQILVDRDKIAEASEVIAKRVNKEIAACPECGSKNIGFGVLGTKHRLRKLLTLLVSAGYTRHVVPTYYCNDCKAEFRT